MESQEHMTRFQPSAEIIAPIEKSRVHFKPFSTYYRIVSYRVESFLLNKVSKMAFDMYQRNICVGIHVMFQTGTELPFRFNLEGFTVFLQNTY